MAHRRDNRYRGRRRTSAQRRPGHLRTNYAEEDIAAFANDLVRLQSVWPPEVIEADRKAALRKAMKTNVIICAVVMVFFTAALVYVVVSDGAPWWSILVGQTIVLASLFLISDLEWGNGACVEQFSTCDQYLDLSRGVPGIFCALDPIPNDSINGYDAFASEGVDHRLKLLRICSFREVLGVENDLRYPVPVSEIDELYPAVVPGKPDPAL